MKVPLAFATVVAHVAASGAASAQTQSERAGVIVRLISCSAITGVAERVACYDTQVDLLNRAEKAGDVVVYDRAEIREARRGLFGLALPKLKIFGNREGSKQDQINEVESRIAQVSTDREGRLLFVLEDGARWRQTDTSTLARRAMPGQPIRIRAAALGSYFAKIDGQTALRVKREN